MEKVRVLHIAQEINPFLPKSEISSTVRNLTQGIQEAGKEIRVFMPRFGVINERRHQLHEVIRLSGMNLIVDDTDHPLIIKVASIPAARMQVYFIDNEEFFQRKATVEDGDGQAFKDNDERSIFFVRGVLETVKKLGWKPDIIHCHGWMTSLASLYLKKSYGDDPHFSDTKAIYSIYDNSFEGTWSQKVVDKLKFDGFKDKDVKLIKEKADYNNLNKLALEHADGVIMAGSNTDKDIKDFVDQKSDIQSLEYQEEENMIKAVDAFYDKILEEQVVID